jgi:hypothetical protein
MSQFLLNWKKCVAVAALTAGVFSAQAQSPTFKRTCAANDVMEASLQANPSLRQNLKTIEAHTARFIQNQQVQNAAATVIKIPVVVHVLYTNSTENISATQIQSQLTVLNQDFRRTNPDRTSKWSQAADTEIEFVLASVDPNGNATNGITRTQTSTSTWNIDRNNDAMKFSSSGGINAWPSGDYLNMWIVGGLTTNAGQTILGYAQFPGSGSAATDGVVMAGKFFGTTGTAQAPFDGGRTTTHEVGHWLNLRHIWGDGNGSCASDFVSDTPESDNPNYGCATGHVSCGSEDMVQNYMDYSDDGCMNLFTQGQKTRMRALFNSGGFRASLLNSPGLGGGGTPPPATCSTNEVVVTITTDNYGSETSWTVKNSSGQTVGSGSGYGNNTTYNTTLCLPNGSYTFTINDTYGDGICCSYGNGSYSVKKGSTTLASGGQFASTENKTFNLGSTPPPPPAPACQTIDLASATINSYGGSQDAGTFQKSGSTLILNGNAWKSINLNYTVTANTVLEFEFGSTQQGEIQGIGFDTDNGISSDRTFRLWGTQNWGINNYNNYASSAGSWKAYAIPVGQFYTGAFNRLFFACDHDVSNPNANVYIRNIKIYEGSCGTTRVADLGTNGAMRVDDAGEFTTMQAYPNPSSGSLNVVMPVDAQATIFDMTGKAVWNGKLVEGENKPIDISGLSNGIYMLKATSADGQNFVERIVKQ